MSAEKHTKPTLGLPWEVATGYSNEIKQNVLAIAGRGKCHTVRTQGARRRHREAYEKSNRRTIISYGRYSTRIFSGHAIRDKVRLKTENEKCSLEEERVEKLRREWRLGILDPPRPWWQFWR